MIWMTVNYLNGNKRCYKLAKIAILHNGLITDLSLMNCSINVLGMTTPYYLITMLSC